MVDTQSSPKTTFFPQESEMREMRGWGSWRGPGGDGLGQGWVRSAANQTHVQAAAVREREQGGWENWLAVRSETWINVHERGEKERETMETKVETERQKDRHREKPRQAERPWVTHCTHVLRVSPACFLRYFEWVSGHIRQPNVNGWIGSNGISETLGHQLSHVNLQWGATEGSWRRNREGLEWGRWGAQGEI